MKWQSQICFKTTIFFLILTLAQMAGGFVFAAENEIEPQPENRSVVISLTDQAAAKGDTVSVFDNAFKLTLGPGAVSSSTEIEVMELNEKIDTPWQLKKLSKVYQFEIKNKAAFKDARPISLQITYDTYSPYLKQVYYYDKNYFSWRPLPTTDSPGKTSVRATINLPFARLAVFADLEALVIGKASWYAYKGGLFAASPDFPKGSRLRVINTANNKFIDVTVNDFGPDRKLHPDRVIDLDKVAFKKISPTGAGIINVRVEPLKIMPEKNGRVLAATVTGVATEFNVSAKSAIVVDEKNGEILWQKNSTSTLPLASLTKLVAIKTLLDTGSNLKQVVTYSVKDEEYNYEYASKWESARLKLNDNETLTIEDLIYAALVGSANNAIETLVRVSGLTRPDFIKKMNENVAGWGAMYTKFVEPTGLSPENVSSAFDYAIITKEVYANPIIQKASTMRQYKFSTLNTKKDHTIANTDKLLTESNLNLTGSKTGYLDEAGYCLMARATGGGKSVIAVVLGAGSRETSFLETEQLLKYGLMALN